jgi:glycosyltransferase involved in cell wall biosynthesis
MIQVTALICTRNRPRQIREAARSLLATPDEAMELIVVDQSEDVDTQQALADWLPDPRVRYHRTRSVGKGAALNEGLQLSRGSTIVLTDDDCIAAPGWVRAMAQLFEDRPRVAIVFCNVRPVEHDRNAGYVPSYERSTDRLLTSLWDLRAGLGLGAGMAIRRETALSLGGFDETFGPGGSFPSADEWDIAIRALVAGWHIYECAQLAIVHDGFRSHSEGKRHALRDWVALGAVSAKPLRRGHLRAASVPLCFYPKRALWPPVRDLLVLRKPRGIRRISAYLRGFALGMVTPMDATSLKFLRRR